MKHEHLTGHTIASPCVRLCTLDEQNICVGCWRSLDEIKQWSVVNDGIRQKILTNCQERLQVTTKIISIHKRQTRKCS